MSQLRNSSQTARQLIAVTDWVLSLLLQFHDLSHAEIPFRSPPQIPTNRSAIPKT